MAQHHIHHTQGIILSSKNRGEANKMLLIYTRELGLVRAAVQGVRHNRSKLRYALQDFSYANIDLVRGKEIWRVTSAAPINSFAFIRSDKEKFLLMARLFSLVERLCAGEEAAERVWDALRQALSLLDSPEFSKDSIHALELHTVLSIVYELGYIGESELLSDYLGKDFADEHVFQILQNRKSIISHINKALRESQL